MDANERLVNITDEDIDWDSLQGMPYIERVKERNAHFPTRVGRYEDGIAAVSWEVNPSGAYYGDSDGFGMTDDREYTLYGYIDRVGNIVGKLTFLGSFPDPVDFDRFKEMRKEAINKAWKPE